MSSALFKAGWVALLTAILIPPFPGLRAQQRPEAEENRVTLDVTRVGLLVAVTDKKGRFVSSLRKEDFLINEDEKAQNILQFHAETDLPLRLAVMVDTSNSVRERFTFIQEAAIAFLESTLRRGRDKAVVISFDTVVESAGDFTDDTAVLAQIIRDLRPGRGTSMYDAVDYACNRKLAPESMKEECRRVIVILGDGDDTQSRYTRAHALEMAHKTDTVMYTISTAMGAQLGTTGTRVLMNLAEETGGRALFPLAVKELANSFRELSTELRSQYSIVYRPDNFAKDGRFHPIRISVKGRKDLHVRTRKGYYAPLK